MSAVNSLGYSVYELDDIKGWIRVSMVQQTVKEADAILDALPAGPDRKVYETVMHKGVVT